MATILITGANRGIGLEFVQQYLEVGDDVIATARKPDDAEALQALAQRFENRLQIHMLDVCDDMTIAELRKKLSGIPIDVLICNAGIYGPRDTATEGWLHTMQTNAIGPMRVAEALVDNLRAGKLKKLVLMTSKMGSMADNGSGGSYVYRSSKAALNAIGKSLAIDLADDGIIVLLTHPGWVRTDMTGPHAPMSTSDSVIGLRNVIGGASIGDSGRFLAYDGQEIPW